MTENNTPTGFRVVADYQMLGDTEGSKWMTEALSLAVEKNDLSNFEVTASVPGSWGIQFITFTADVPFGEKFKEDGLVEDLAKAASNLLNETVGDSDVEVRWIGVA